MYIKFTNSKNRSQETSLQKQERDMQQQCGLCAELLSRHQRNASTSSRIKASGSAAAVRYGRGL